MEIAAAATDVTAPPASRRMHRLTLAVILVALTAYIAYAAAVWRAQTDAASIDPASLSRALRLQPEDASLHWRRSLAYSHVELDDKQAHAELQRAMYLNPYVADYHLEAARLLLMSSGDEAARDRALEQAVHDAPTSPEILWAAANLYVADGDTDRAYPLLKRIAANDRERERAALSLAWRASGRDLQTILAKALPATPEAYETMLDIVPRTGDRAASAAIWQLLKAADPNVPLNISDQYVDYLVLWGDGAQARSVWQWAAQKNHLIPYSTDNLAYNGDLRQPPTQRGLDWHFAVKDGVATSFDDSDPAQHAVKISLHGKATDPGPYEFVAVAPNTTYRFSALVRTKDLLSKDGICFWVHDVPGDKTELLTNNLIGTNPWTPLTGTFRTGPNTSMVEVIVTRKAASEAIGDAWIAAVNITPAPQK